MTEKVKRMRQIEFFEKSVLYAGGELGKGQRKVRRPLCSRRSLHLTLKSNLPNLRENKNIIAEHITHYAGKFNIRIYKYSVQKDHTHLLLKVPNRSSHYKFIRALTGVLARKLKVTWKLLPFTRVVAWGRDFKAAADYIQKNEDEVLSLRAYAKRKPHAKYNLKIQNSGAFSLFD